MIALMMIVYGNLDFKIPRDLIRKVRNFDNSRPISDTCVIR